MIRFLAHENVSRLVVERLRAAGWDVLSIGGALGGASDSEVLETARREGRIPITEDRDFGEMVVRQRLGVAGVILLELDRLSNQAEAEQVGKIVAAHTERLEGALTVVEPGRVRFRLLARSGGVD
ncbi:MAG: DUF5615 family PIN-like protein [Roseiarcus sp.]